MTRAGRLVVSVLLALAVSGCGVIGGKGGGDEREAFCADAESLTSASADEARATLEDLVEDAPTAIREDIELMLELTDPNEDPTAASASDDPEHASARERFVDLLDRQCGIAL